MDNNKIYKVSILTLFPEIFPGPLGVSLLGNALQKKLWELNLINIRDFAKDKHKSVDDTPYGGGAGMVMKPDIIEMALNSISDFEDLDIKINYKVPLLRCSLSIAKKRALKFPFPKELAPLLCIISKNIVGL